ncbi:hypothetical protein HYPSUDRAFT_398168 [Hypholoma sublateritium FD-334 SS-4]|uniref:Uncharacterized protein n=1 Tax=Hypholoma sublateritium (strain FD-334 SS-4) TaxID=945553 RepID=A0A0D2LWC0_HYPSF|nr:hypothetical protein HYPSUDRAFT_398168 [Hypholoma sublateritium FD-334 SS-4]
MRCVYSYRPFFCSLPFFVRSPALCPTRTRRTSRSRLLAGITPLSPTFPPPPGISHPICATQLHCTRRHLVQYVHIALDYARCALGIGSFFIAPSFPQSLPFLILSFCIGRTHASRLGSFAPHHPCSLHGCVYGEPRRS